MSKKEISFVHNGEQINNEVDLVSLPQIGEWVQLRTDNGYQTFVVKHVLHKFVRGFSSIKDPIHRIIFILEEIKEEN